MKRSLAISGSVLSAFLAFVPAACCLGPLALVVAGLGSAGFGLVLLPYAPYFSGAALVFLGISFHLTYRRSGAACEPGSACAVSTPSKWQKLMLWATAGAVVAMSVLPFAIGYLPPF